MGDIAFFDLNSIGISRHPRSIARELSHLHTGLQYHFIYEEGEPITEEVLQAEYPPVSSLYPIGETSALHTGQLLDRLSPRVLVLMAQRIPDIAFITAARKRGIPTVLVQHGLLVPFMQRQPILFWNKIRKTIRYIRYATACAHEIGHPVPSILQAFVNTFVRGIPYTETGFAKYGFNSDYVLTYGTAWNRYFIETYGYSEDQLTIMGYPDLDALNTIRQSDQNDAVCYIAQSLVEDGRLPASVMRDFMAFLADSLGDDRQLYIKLHPRSDLRLFDAVQPLDPVFIRDGDLPHCTMYLGHYSTLLATGAYLSPHIVLWEFPDHPTPDYIADVASDVCLTQEELERAIRDPGGRVIDADIRRLNLEEHFFYNPDGVIHTIARAILDLIEHGTIENHS